MSHILDFSFVAFRSLVSALSQLTRYKSNVTEVITVKYLIDKIYSHFEDLI